jgi:hypothetical protein
MGRDQAASRRQKAPHDRYRDCEGRIGHYPKGSLRKTEVARVDLNHGHRETSEPLPELPGPDGVKFHGDDLGPSCDQWRRERS